MFANQVQYPTSKLHNNMQAIELDTIVCAPGPVGMGQSQSPSSSTVIMPPTIEIQMDFSSSESVQEARANGPIDNSLLKVPGSQPSSQSSLLQVTSTNHRARPLNRRSELIDESEVRRILLRPVAHFRRSNSDPSDLNETCMESDLDRVWQWMLANDRRSSLPTRYNDRQMSEL